MSNLALLPPNATAQEVALSEAVARVGDVPVIVREVWNADTCPADLLPWLARAVSVDVWDANWSSDQKRATIRSSLTVHREKGTIGAVRKAMAALGFDARVQEWFNQSPPGPEYTYRLILEADQIGFSKLDVELLLEVIEQTKNLRSHLTEIAPIVRTLAGPTVAAVIMLGVEMTLPVSDLQEATLISNFVPAENELDTITNTDLAQSLGNI